LLDTDSEETTVSVTNIPTRPESGDGGKQLLTIAEVAHRLNVEVRHIRRLVHERRIPFIKWGHLLRFDPDEIQEWIDGYRQSPGPGKGA
jgi:excisionase family DNA binding protein